MQINEIELTIINYHSFFDSGSYYKNIFKGPTKDELIIQISQLKSSPLKDINQLEALDKNKKYHLFTIDDGFKTTNNIIDVLSSWNIRPIVFIPDCILEKKEVLNTHKVNLIREKLTDIQFYKKIKLLTNIDEQKLSEYYTNSYLYRYDTESTRKVKIIINYILPIAERTDIINQIFNKLFNNEEQIFDDLYLSYNNLLRLASFAEIGFHTKNHEMLTKVSSKEELINELTPSKKLLELMPKNYSLSIPYGHKDTYNKEIINSSSATNIFTMLRNKKHFIENNKRIFHRFDQREIMSLQ